MADVKITLAPGESPEDAKEALLKALKAQAKPSAAHLEKFPQPAAQAVAEALEAAHAKMWKKMLAEIEAVIDGDLKE